MAAKKRGIQLRKCSSFRDCPYQTHSKEFMGGEQACAGGSKTSSCTFRHNKPRKK